MSIVVVLTLGWSRAVTRNIPTTAQMKIVVIEQKPFSADNFINPIKTSIMSTEYSTDKAIANAN